MGKRYEAAKARRKARKTREARRNEGKKVNISVTETARIIREGAENFVSEVPTDVSEAMEHGVSLCDKRTKTPFAFIRAPGGVVEGVIDVGHALLLEGEPLTVSIPKAMQKVSFCAETGSGPSTLVRIVKVAALGETDAHDLLAITRMAPGVVTQLRIEPKVKIVIVQRTRNDIMKLLPDK